MAEKLTNIVLTALMALCASITLVGVTTGDSVWIYGSGVGACVLAAIRIALDRR